MSEVITEKPFIAEEILSGQVYVDEVVPDVIKRLQDTSLSDYKNQMVNPRFAGFTHEQVTQVRFVDLRSVDEGSAKKAVVFPLPEGRSYSPEMHIRAKAIQELLPEDTRLIVIPNNTRRESYYSFGFLGQNDAVETLGHLILETCSRLKLEDIVVTGYEQGASVSANIINDAANYDINISSVILGDPVDVEERTPKQLKEALWGSSLGNLNEAINDCGIPALSEAQCSRRGLDAYKQIFKFFGVHLDSRVAENVSLHESMTNDNFVDNLHNAVSKNNRKIEPANLHVVRMELSKIATEVLDIQMLEDPLLSDCLTVVEGYGHEGGDNVIDWALRVRKAVQGSNFYAS